MDAVILALALLASAAASPPRWRAELGVERVAWLGSVAWNAGRAQALALHWRVPGAAPVELGLTGRLFQAELVLPRDSYELGLEAVYAPTAARVYRPAIGLEVGASGAVRIDWKGYHGQGWEEQDPVDRADYRPWFVGIVGEPLRVALGPVVLSTLGFSLSSLAGARVVRARASLLQGGVQW